MSFCDIQIEQKKADLFVGFVEQNVPAKKVQISAASMFEAVYRAAEAYAELSGLEMPREILRLKPRG